MKNSKLLIDSKLSQTHFQFAYNLPLKWNETIVFLRALWIPSFSAHDAITLFFSLTRETIRFNRRFFRGDGHDATFPVPRQPPFSGSARDREAALGFWVDERGYAARWGRLVTDSLRASRRRRHLCAFAPPLSNNRDPFDTPTPTS